MPAHRLASRGATPWLLLAIVACATTIAVAQTDGDDFDDGVVDATKWGTAIVAGNGTMAEIGGRLEFTVDAPTAKDQSQRPWIVAVGPYDASWEVQLDVYDDTSPAENDEVTSVGIDVLSSRDFDDEFFAELYTSNLGAPPLRSGFHAELLTDSAVVGPVADSGGIGVTTGAVRIAFDAAGKVLTASYDVDPSNGHTWVPFASYGVAGTGGADGNGDFGMTSDDHFVVWVYGFAASMVVTSGQMWADNFVTTGLTPLTPPTTSTTSTSTSTTTTTTIPPPCPVAPRTGCRRTTAGKGALTIKDKSGSRKDTLAWQWRKGAATTTTELGEPDATTAYHLCAYDAVGPRLDAVAQAAGMCGRKPCWKASKRGYRFRDKAGNPDGIVQLQLTAGAAGKATITLAARGANLVPPPLPLALPVTVQLVRNDGGPCWETTFAAARKNVPGRFEAGSD